MTLAWKTLAAAALVLGGLCAAVSGAEAKSIQSGGASWYGPGFHGKRTANGERFNTHTRTAAHRSGPFAAGVRVTTERTGRSEGVPMTGRGPSAGGRVCDPVKSPPGGGAIWGVGRVKLTRL